MAAKYASSGLIVLAVNTWDEDEGQLRKWVETERLRQRVLVYGREVGDLYGVGGSVPAVLWIDPAGNVVATQSGKIGPLHLEHHTRQLLARRSSPS